MSWRESRRIRKSQSGQGRVKFLALFFVIFAILIIARLFDLQILKGNLYGALAMGQHELYEKLFPERGSIYVVERHGDKQTLFPLVTNRELKMLYAIPAKIEKPKETAEKIFEILGYKEEPDREKIGEELFKDISPDLDPKMIEEIQEARWETWLEEQKELEIDNLVKILSKENDPYEPLRRRLSDEEVEQLQALEIEGLGFKDEVWRFYPEKGMGGHVFGFWGFDGDKRKGKYGLEGYFDDILSGQFGEIHSERDVWGNIIAVGSHSLQEKVDGSDLVITIDRAIQYKVCQALYDAVERYEAKGGSIIVMNPKTGGILAMCGAPDFDPDNYSKVEDISVYNNPAVYEAYEPGSIFKPLTMAAALDAGKIEPQTIYEDEGFITIGEDTIKNFENKVYGKQTMTQVLEKSINTGTIWAMRQTTPEVFTKYVRDFGFGKPTGMKLGQEAWGNISNLDRYGEIYAATASYGQGITATPVQMVAAMGALANGGKLMKPYVVSQVINENDEIENYYPQEMGQVVSSRAAQMLGAMMVSVVENGHGKAAQVDGYRIAGKTGTAQIASKVGRGYTGDVVTSFLGFGPFSDPKFVMLVRIDAPQNGRVGAVVAAPVFGDIAKFILQYYNVPKDGI